jgi:hypothetical protein
MRKQGFYNFLGSCSLTEKLKFIDMLAKLNDQTLSIDVKKGIANQVIYNPCASQPDIALAKSIIAMPAAAAQVDFKPTSTFQRTQAASDVLSFKPTAVAPTTVAPDATMPNNETQPSSDVQTKPQVSFFKSPTGIAIMAITGIAAISALIVIIKK